MGILVAITYGCIQGLTEFLPVSSSGHLKIAHLLGLGVLERRLDTAFDVLLHLASLTAIVIAFRREIAQACRRGPHFWTLVAVAVIPAGLAGLLGEGEVDAFGTRWWLVGLGFTWTAGWLLTAHRLTASRQGGVPDADPAPDTAPAPDADADASPPLADVTFRRALLVGLLQVPALLPGVSRSGATIAAGLVGGLRPATALAFSFIVGLPLIAGAAGKKALDGGFGELVTAVGWAGLIAACTTCLAVSLLGIHLLRLALRGRHLHWFAGYCGLLAIGCFVVMLLGY